MALRRIVIAVPEDLLGEVDRAARRRRESRTQFLTRVLRHVVRGRRDVDVTRRLDALFADSSLAVEQVRGASALDRAGTDWEDEAW